MMYRVTATALNLREGPEMKARVVRELPRHTAVLTPRPQGSAPGWLAVRTFDGSAGWVASRHITLDPSPWASVARAEMRSGVREEPGVKHAARILEYHGTTTLKATADEIPWCSAFANWCMLQTGIVGTRLANARSWLQWGRVLTDPVPGCVMVLTRGNDLASGHVGFYLRRAGTKVYLLGGNQSNAITESGYLRSRVLGYRWPAAAPLPDVLAPAA